MVGFIAYWQHSIRPVIDGDITAALASDVSAFVSSHGGRLPSDWTEFTKWMNTSKSSTRWKPVELEKRFRIQANQLTESPDVPVYIEIIDEDLKKMQDYFNRSIHQTTKS